MAMPAVVIKGRTPPMPSEIIENPYAPFCLRASIVGGTVRIPTFDHAGDIRHAETWKHKLRSLTALERPSQYPDVA